MDASRFDAAARRLAMRLTRRHAVAALVGLAATAGAGGAQAADPARTTCRKPNSACVNHAQCCTGICDTSRVRHRTRRNRCGCAAPLTACGDQCVDTTSAAKHCGACGHRCAEGLICRDGSCATPSCAESDAPICIETVEGTIVEIDHFCFEGSPNACSSSAWCEATFIQRIGYLGPQFPEQYLSDFAHYCMTNLYSSGERQPIEDIPGSTGRYCVAYPRTAAAVLCTD
jgi:hypothetical protein